MVHLSSSEIKSNKELIDPDFSLSFRDSLRLKRVTEYCQWVETYVDTTHEDSRGNKHTIRTYYYSKMWSPIKINSLLFDQPFAHHNPQRDPFPTYSLTTPSGFFFFLF